MGSAVYRRLISGVKPGLDGAQFARIRKRGTEMHLVNLTDFARLLLSRAPLCFSVSFDVLGAFDNVTHVQLTRVLGVLGVDGPTQGASSTAALGSPV